MKTKTQELDELIVTESSLQVTRMAWYGGDDSPEFDVSFEKAELTSNKFADPVVVSKVAIELLEKRAELLEKRAELQNVALISKMKELYGNSILVTQAEFSTQLYTLSIDEALKSALSAMLD